MWAIRQQQHHPNTYRNFKWVNETKASSSTWWIKLCLKSLWIIWKNKGLSKRPIYIVIIDWLLRKQCGCRVFLSCPYPTISWLGELLEMRLTIKRGLLTRPPYRFGWFQFGFCSDNWRTTSGKTRNLIRSFLWRHGKLFLTGLVATPKAGKNCPVLWSVDCVTSLWDTHRKKIQLNQLELLKLLQLTTTKAISTVGKLSCPIDSTGYVAKIATLNDPVRWKFQLKGRTICCRLDT